MSCILNEILTFVYLIVFAHWMFFFQLRPYSKCDCLFLFTQKKSTSFEGGVCVFPLSLSVSSFFILGLCIKPIPWKINEICLLLSMENTPCLCFVYKKKNCGRLFLTRVPISVTLPKPVQTNQCIENNIFVFGSIPFSFSLFLSLSQ